MTQTTLLEKFKIIFEVSKSSKIFIAVILFIILLAIVGLTTNRHNIKRGKRIYALVYFSILVSVLIFYHSSLGKMFDYMMNNFFIVLYFPNVAVYLAAIIITNIILIVSVFNLKTTKLIKNINITIYGIIHYLLALVLNIITKNNLDIFSQVSVYSNKEAQAIIELSSAIFIIWIIFLAFYKIIRKYQQKDVVPVTRKVVVKKVRQLPESIAEVQIPRYVKAQPKKKEMPKTLNEEPVFISQLTDEYLLEKASLEKQLEKTQEQLKIEAEKTIQMHELKTQLELAKRQIRAQEELLKINEEQKLKLEQEQSKLEKEQIKLEYEQTQLQQEKVKLQQENRQLQALRSVPIEETQEQKVDATATIMKNLDNMFTLEDYKVLATILKDKQKKQNEQKLREEIRKKEQQKFAQLQEAYRSVR